MGWEPRTRDDEWRALVLGELREIRRLLQHLRPVQLGVLGGESAAEESSYRCHKCGREFSSSRALGRHSGWCQK